MWKGKEYQRERARGRDARATRTYPAKSRTASRKILLWESTVVEVRALASRTTGGNAPAHFTIQFMGTPLNKELRARSNKALDLGRSSTNRFCSRCRREWRRGRSMGRIEMTAPVPKYLKLSRETRKSNRTPQKERVVEQGTVFARMAFPTGGYTIRYTI